MAVLFSNNASTTLSAGVSSSATSITVADGSVFPSISGSDYFYITLEDILDESLFEICSVTARSGNTLTITRGEDNTSGRAFSSGDNVELRLTAAALNDAVGNNNTTEMLLNQFTGDGSTTSFTLSNSPVENLTSVFLSGVYQSKSNYSISGSSLTFLTAPPNGLAIEVMVAKTVEFRTIALADNVISTSKIVDGGVTLAKLETALSTKINGIESGADITDTANVVSALSAGTGVSLSAGGEIANTSPDQTVSLTGAGTTTVTGTYPNFTITSTDSDTTYTAGSGLTLTGTEFTNNSPDQTVSLTGADATTVTGTYPNFTITSTDSDTTYTAGSGLTLTGTEFTNDSPDQTVSLTGAGATTVTGTYPNFTITSTDSDTSYTAGSGLTLTGTEFTNDSPDQTVVLTGADATTVSGTYPNFTITSTDTTYSIGDGGLSEISFTSADNSKLDAINQGVATTDSPTFSSMTLNGVDAIVVPVGTTAQRPTGAAGQLRYNSTTAEFEGYTTEWGAIGGGLQQAATPTLSSSADAEITVTNHSSYNSPTYRVKRGTEELTFTISGGTISIISGFTAGGSQTISVEVDDFGDFSQVSPSDLATVTVTLPEPYRYYKLKNFNEGNGYSEPILTRFALYAQQNGSSGYTFADSRFSASYYYSNSYRPALANNTSTSQGWWILSSPNTSGYSNTIYYDHITIDAGSPIVVRSALIGWNSNYWSAIATLQGSNDNSTWTTLKTLTGMTAGSQNTVNL